MIKPRLDICAAAIARFLAPLRLFRRSVPMLVAALIAAAISSSAVAEPVQTWRLQNKASGKYLVQDDFGEGQPRVSKDSERNVSVGPLSANGSKLKDSCRNRPSGSANCYVTVPRPLKPNEADSFPWVLDSTGDPGYFYVVNLKNGLVLTQDGSGNDSRNVSLWGRLPNSRRQQWKLVREPTEKLNEYLLINRETGQGLDQAYQGTRRDENNVMTWPNVNFADSGFVWKFEAAGMRDLAKLTVESVKCIRPTSGQDGYTRVMFAAMDVAISGAAGGLLKAGSTSVQGVRLLQGQAAAKSVLKSAFAKGALKGAGKEAMDKLKTEAAARHGLTLEQLSDVSVETIFNTVYGESPDELFLEIGSGVTVWPNGGRDSRKIKSQQTLPIQTEFVFDRSKALNMAFWERDLNRGEGNNSWPGGADDKIASIQIDAKGVTAPERYEDLLLRNSSEGSVYQVTFVVEPYPRPVKVVELKSVFGSYRQDLPHQNKWQAGQIVLQGGFLRWINEAGASWALNPDLQRNALVTGPENPYRTQGYPDFTLVAKDRQVIGFRFAGAYYAKYVPITIGQVLGKYQYERPQNGWHTGQIVQQGNALRWVTEAGASWSLTPDFAGERLVTGTDNPYYDKHPEMREFKLIIGNGKVAGFRFNGVYNRQ